MLKIIFVLSGGAMGSALRYFFSDFLQKFSYNGFPLGTFSVNLIGSFIIGILWSVAEIFKFPLHYRLFIFTGVLGGFTTFSSFSIETINLFRDNQIKIALIYIFSTNILGIALAFAGIFLGKNLIGLLK